MLIPTVLFLSLCLFDHYFYWKFGPPERPPALGYETFGRPERPAALGYETFGRPERPAALGYETFGRPERAAALGYETFGGAPWKWRGAPRFHVCALRAHFQ